MEFEGLRTIPLLWATAGVASHNQVLPGSPCWGKNTHTLTPGPAVAYSRNSEFHEVMRWDADRPMKKKIGHPGAQKKAQQNFAI